MQLYDWQREAIDELEHGSGRVLVVAPTGGGKSMCYQQPAIDLDGIVLVITPLVALMADQVRSLTERGIPATYLASNLDADENRRRIELALTGQVKLLYIAPERLASDWFIDDVLSQLPISLLAIDEAHCISHWGHDFRPDYLQLGALVARLQPPRLIACTATATPAVRREIVERLAMPDARQILRGFARGNLQLAMEEVSGPKAKATRIAAEVKTWLGKPGGGRGSAIVYAGTRRSSEDVAEAMRAAGWRAAHYHAGMPGPDRTEVQERFQAGALDVIAATNAFGMGIDRADIRLVVHQTLPESVEAYYQEVGRAGRDGDPAAGLLLVSDPDIAWRFGMIAKDELTPPEQALHRRDLLRAMVSYAETCACRHDAILEYFEDTAEELGGCGHCDNCIAAASGRMGAEPDEAASAETVRTALSAIRGLPFAVGAGATASYLIGDATRQVRGYGWEAHTAFGALRDLREEQVRRLLRRCVAAGLLAVEAEHSTLRITRRAAEVVARARENPVRLPPQPPRPAGRASGSSAPPAAGLTGVGLALFNRLKAWRKHRAEEVEAPAYVVAPDATLRAIAEARPATAEALAAVHGMGPAKMLRFGEEILALVREDAAATPEPEAPATPEPAAPERNFSEHQIEVRKSHPRAWERWSDDEDAHVTKLAGAGSGVDEIAADLGRQPHAVRLRMEKLGLIEPEPAAIPDPAAT
jgi:ATP-dependent DNA helicase RecQ